MVLITVAFSLVTGLTGPDTSVQIRTADATTTPPVPASIPTQAATSDQAPASDPWPGDFCADLEVDATAEATVTFGPAQVSSAACAAVTFVFEQRYSALSLPRERYRRSDFDDILDSMTQATGNLVYRQRIDDFLAAPTRASAADGTGLVLLQSAGPGRRFYDRGSSWTRPTWSTVQVTVDHTKAAPRVVTTFTAEAGLPVFNTEKRSDELLVVPTSARYEMRREGDRWLIGGWRLEPSNPRYVTAP